MRTPGGLQSIQEDTVLPTRGAVTSNAFGLGNPAILFIRLKLEIHRKAARSACEAVSESFILVAGNGFPIIVVHRPSSCVLQMKEINIYQMENSR